MLTGDRALLGRMAVLLERIAASTAVTKRPCAMCDGTGVHHGRYPHVDKSKPCHYCNATGWRYTREWGVTDTTKEVPTDAD